MPTCHMFFQLQFYFRPKFFHFYTKNVAVYTNLLYQFYFRPKIFPFLHQIGASIMLCFLHHFLLTIWHYIPFVIQHIWKGSDRPLHTYCNSLAGTDKPLKSQKINIPISLFLFFGELSKLELEIFITRISKQRPK